MNMLEALLGGLVDALSLAFGMTWEILWALILGCALSAAAQAVVSKRDDEAFVRRLASLDRDCDGLGGGQLVLLVCCGGAGPLYLS